MNGGLVGTKAVTKDYPVEIHVCDFRRGLCNSERLNFQV